MKLHCVVILSLWSITSSNPAVAANADFHFIPGTFQPELGPDGNTVIYETASGLIVIDSGRHPTHAQKILDHATVRSLPIVTVINTHWHLDHTTGNLDIKAAYPDAKIHSTSAIEGALTGFLAPSIESSRALLEDPSIEADRRDRTARFLAAIDEGMVRPDVAVEASMSLPLNGGPLELNVTSHAVTESDIWIWDAVTKTVIAGDLVTLPVPFFDTACAAGWNAAFDAIEQKPYERVVPGHGYIMTPDEFRLYRKAFDKLVACAAERSGSDCAEGWLADAAPLLDKAPDADYADKAWARAAATYYVDEVIRPPERQLALCQSVADD